MSKFLVWIDNPTTTNVVDYANLVNDTQKANGFQVGQAASSSRVNTMLRQNSLLTVGIWNALGLQDDTSVDVSSTLASIVNKISDTNLFRLNNTLLVLTSTSNPNSRLITAINRSISVSLGTAALPFTDIISRGVKSLNLLEFNQATGTSLRVTGTVGAKNVNATKKITAVDIEAEDMSAKTIAASDGFVGDLEGNVTGNVTGTADKAGTISKKLFSITYSFVANDDTRIVAQSLTIMSNENDESYAVIDARATLRQDRRLNIKATACYELVVADNESVNRTEIYHAIQFNQNANTLRCYYLTKTGEYHSIYSIAKYEIYATLIGTL